MPFEMVGQLKPSKPGAYHADLASKHSPVL
jgi:hypothetical protein